MKASDAHSSRHKGTIGAHEPKLTNETAWTYPGACKCCCKVQQHCLSNAAWTVHGLTSGQQANVSEEGVVDLEGVERIQASMIYGRHQDVLLAFAAGASGTLKTHLADMLGAMRQTSVMRLPQCSYPYAVHLSESMIACLLRRTSAASELKRLSRSLSQLAVLPEELEVGDGLGVVAHGVAEVNHGLAEVR